jgi:hypothetical protein
MCSDIDRHLLRSRPGHAQHHEAAQPMKDNWYGLSPISKRRKNATGSCATLHTTKGLKRAPGWPSMASLLPRPTL